ncbi:MAG: hypothetical protein PHT40_01080 [Patescibacteria group bacterium]|nr:hypothetical protein [Patescibacteria group bacterium]
MIYIGSLRYIITMRTALSSEPHKLYFVGLGREEKDRANNGQTGRKAQNSKGVIFMKMRNIGIALTLGGVGYFFIGIGCFHLPAQGHIFYSALITAIGVATWTTASLNRRY